MDFVQKPSAIKISCPIKPSGPIKPCISVKPRDLIDMSTTFSMPTKY